MHWVIQTFSNKQIKAEYKFEYNEQSVTALVTLDRTDDMEVKSEEWKIILSRCQHDGMWCRM